MFRLRGDDRSAVASDSLLTSLRTAVEAAPDDVPLRMHLAEMLAAEGNSAEAVRYAAGVLQRDPDNTAAVRLISSTTNPDSAALAPPLPGPADQEAETLRRLDSELADLAPPDVRRKRGARRARS